MDMHYVFHAFVNSFCLFSFILSFTDKQSWKQAPSEHILC